MRCVTISVNTLRFFKCGGKLPEFKDHLHILLSNNQFLKWLRNTQILADGEYICKVIIENSRNVFNERIFYQGITINGRLN